MALAVVGWGDWELALGIFTVGLGRFPPSLPTTFPLPSGELISVDVGFALIFPGHSHSFALLRQLPMVVGLALNGRAGVCKRGQESYLPLVY